MAEPYFEATVLFAVRGAMSFGVVAEFVAVVSTAFEVDTMEVEQYRL